MKVTSTDIKNNFGKYIRLAIKEDIVITKNGKEVGKLTASTSYLNDSEAKYETNRKIKSYDEFLKMSRDNEKQFEYIDEEIYQLASPKTTHQKILFDMAGTFHPYFKEKKCTPMMAPYDIKLIRSNGSINVVQPDLMVICDLDDQLNDEDYYLGVPTFIVEITSKSTKSIDYVKKLDLYLNCGVTEYWIVDASIREVHTYLFCNREIINSKTYSFDQTAKSFSFEGLEVSFNRY
ncbi:MAG: type II toxin-antitoxin system Phd/YefM family antitoxin [Clostridia bacterium]|nr:type II toxin-antitoxin system Phd/YefM family antitoxin [Clostridia bacterium]